MLRFSAICRLAVRFAQKGYSDACRADGTTAVLILGVRSVVRLFYVLDGCCLPPTSDLSWNSVLEDYKRRKVSSLELPSSLGPAIHSFACFNHPLFFYDVRIIYHPLSFLAVPDALRSCGGSVEGLDYLQCKPRSGRCDPIVRACTIARPTRI